MTVSIQDDVDAFVVAQNKSRGGSLPGGGVLPFDYDVLTGLAPSGGNAVTGISGIAAGAGTITLPAGQAGNAVIIDGGISTIASTSGVDSYSLAVATSGVVTLTDNNTGNSQTITGASYLLFNGAATTSAGAYQSLYIIETGVNAEMAAMYNAAFGRVPDMAGLEFYEDQYGTSALADLHQMATYFNLSPEFKVLWPTLQTAPDNGGPNDIAYINALYGKILGRTPNASEMQFYVNALQGKLTDSHGNPEPASDRADLLEYFSVSPENLTKIAATNGGWLINPANGAVNFGALTIQAAQQVLASEITTGTINASAFDTLPATSSNSGATDTLAVNGITITGPSATIGGSPIIGQTIATGPHNPNITINLDDIYFNATMASVNVTVNTPENGGAVIRLPSQMPSSTSLNYGGTVNLSGPSNFIIFGNGIAGGITVPTVINGWTSQDVLGQSLAAPNGTTYGFQNTSELSGHYGVLLNGTPDAPASLAAYENAQGYISNSIPFAVNVGAIADDSITSMVTAINQSFHVLDAVNGERAFFIGQDPQGNTMVYYWRGDFSTAHTVLAADLGGSVELVGVQASTLTGQNFHN